MADEIRNVFISHVHEDDDHVEKLKDLVATKGYQFRDSSISKEKFNNATHEGYIKSELLAPNIQWAGTLLVLISATTHKSDWVNWEIEYAAKSDKKIVGVWLPGAKESDLPEALDKHADAVVGWNGDSIVGAVEGSICNWTNSDGSVRQTG